MRALLGVDVNDVFRKGAVLLAALKFPDLQVELLNVVESVLPDGSFPELGPDHPLSEMLEKNRQEGEACLDSAAALLSSYGLTSSRKIRKGDSGKELVRESDEGNYDLIAVGSERKGLFGSMFLGSVVKSLLIYSRRSLLIAKSEVPTDRKLTAVLATDHSEYNLRCMDELLRFNPQNIGKLVIAYATQIELERAEQANQDLAVKLGPLADEVTTVVSGDAPRTMINELVKEHGADLVILGAAGHGWVERFTIGSVSFNQAVAEPHNVLVLRTS